jgi:hypothetical protein
MNLRPSCILLSSAIFFGSVVAAQPPQSDTRKPAPEGSAISDARSVLGKVNYDRARDLTLHLQATLRSIKAYQREMVAEKDEDKRRVLEARLDEEIGRGVEQTIAILSFLQESGFEDVIYKHREELAKGFTQGSLPPYEKEIFLNAGFSEQDFNQFVAFFETHGQDVLLAQEKSGGVAGLKDRLRTAEVRDKGRRASKLSAYMKIFGGAVGIVGDCTIGIVVGLALPPAAAVGIVASAGAGLSVAADGVKLLDDDKRNH